jgi:hypothetical protein
MVDKAIGIIMALIVLTFVAVIISRRSNVVAVLNSVFNGLNRIQKTAISPVVG